MMTGYFDLIPGPIAGPIIYVDRIYSTETVDGLAARYCRDRAQAFLGYVPRKFTVKNPLIYLIFAKSRLLSALHTSTVTG